MKPSRFAGIQQLGRALMLPIAVLPVAGLLLRLGQPDLLDIAVMAQAGDAIFANLALIFAIGVAVGFARENNGTAGLAGAIGYLVLTAVLKASDAKINMGVLAGITAGLSAGLLYNRCKDIALPSYLAFFGGKRFVPIATGFAMLLAGVLLSLLWPPVQQGIDALGHWLIGAGGLGLFIYGVLNRLLIVTGLHHILNSLTWFVFGSFPDPLVAGKIATGDLNRFFAGDPTAGSFMTGFFPVMMFGLPAACLAIYRAARPENRAAVGGLLLSMGLTAMLTGVTEPVEFSFMFLAPLLYAIHALLTGLSMALMHALDVRLGFTFSAGLFDYLLSFGKGHNGLLLLPVGLAYGLVYYLLFSFFIRRFKLPTMGREEGGAGPAPTVSASGRGSARAQGLLVALGGAANLRSVDACTTRLRLQVADNGAIDAAALRALGARGVIMPAPGSVQVVLGPEADQVADELRALQGQAPQPPAAAMPPPPVPPVPPAELRLDRRAWLLALGGEANVQRIEAVAGTRLRVVLGDAARVDEAALLGLGALGLQSFSPALVHVLLADAAAAHAALLAERAGP
ncbi:N-acetylglucosamine-specific PTS transporter subunit IIBC [Paucibacter sediminis]|uniref:N-acetylglucosamine-specific PTS transporter subunit IIBC n=1 Tax=Paucibacter sediminis TaxID=3019553 RepID=A0AA95NHZ3_9BURK|nr:N-acetylglucosamine-specific PTS transporter subunit IIBC [Paucibacter sp. S2-9]WIT11251.1 N-acetylglucosamine-specific PTS transporter subunit IIBC [Paucibacter sp. S2-9]